MRLPLTITVLLFAALTLAGTSAMADNPPGRVGRLAYVEGTVSFHLADDNQWSPAVLNYPVTTGTSFWTEPNSRTEIQVGGMEIRMDQSTELDVTQLDDNGTQIEIGQGTANIHLRDAPLGGPVQINAPQGQVIIDQAGTYHIDAGQPDANHTPAAQLAVTVLEGQVQVNTANSTLEVRSGEEALVGSNTALQEGDATPFDDWALAREKREVELQSVKYVSPAMTGYEDLDANGQWSTDPTYGAVWYPTVVQPDWAPYHYGHWAYIEPWGWTWVDDAPWGFAPFHYGRWAQIHGRWGWCPGQIVAAQPPVYAPALVVFLGGAELTIGNAEAVAWVPLGPFEVYHPYYHVDNNYLRRINVMNVRPNAINNINGNIANINVTKFANYRAATMVSSSTFTHAGSVHQGAISALPEQLAHAHAAPDMTHFKPTPAAKMGGVPSAHTEAPHPAAEPLIPHEAVQGHPSLSAPGPAITHEHEMTSAPHPEEAHGPPSEPARPTEARPAVEPQREETFAPTVVAPGPPIHPHVAVQQNTPTIHAAPNAAPGAPYVAASRPQLPPANIPHPVQKTQITHTPSGWKRVPAQYKEEGARSGDSGKDHDHEGGK